MKSDNLLDNVIFLTKKLTEKVIDYGYSKGIIVLSNDDITPILSINKINLIDVYINNSTSVELEQLDNYVGQNLTLEIKTGNVINYFETLEDFVYGNKFSCNLKDFYIVDIDFRENTNENKLISNYKKNLNIINFLKETL